MLRLLRRRLQQLRTAHNLNKVLPIDYRKRRLKDYNAIKLASSHRETFPTMSPRCRPPFIILLKRIDLNWYIVCQGLTRLPTYSDPHFNL